MSGHTPKPSPSEEIVKKIKARAAELGFCALGIASAKGTEAFALRLTNRPRPPFVPWDPEQRCSPRTWLEDAKSVMVGAISYRDRYSRTKLESGQGYISPFARQPDYHQVLTTKLEALGRFLTDLEPTARYVIQADNGPGCERIFAVQAGIGWHGKNNFIIVPGYGSFVWLGLLTTNLELPPDQPLSSQCGSCDLCLRACPTKAYSAPHQFDHNLCMAYWAADKGKLSPAQCRMLSRHRIIYGCDYCQLACPNNQLSAVEEADLPSLEMIMTMTRGEFERLFMETAAGWRGRNLLRRNAVLASAGNPQLKAVIQGLAQGGGMVAQYARSVLAGFPQEDE